MAQDDADAKTEDAKAAPPRKSWFRRTINAIEACASVAFFVASESGSVDARDAS